MKRAFTARQFFFDAGNHVFAKDHPGGPQPCLPVADNRRDGCLFCDIKLLFELLPFFRRLCLRNPLLQALDSPVGVDHALFEDVGKGFRGGDSLGVVGDQLLGQVDAVVFKVFCGFRAFQIGKVVIVGIPGLIAGAGDVADGLKVGEHFRRPRCSAHA